MSFTSHFPNMVDERLDWHCMENLHAILIKADNSIRNRNILEQSFSTKTHFLSNE